MFQNDNSILNNNNSFTSFLNYESFLITLHSLHNSNSTYLAHININSLEHKLTDIASLINTLKIDILMISETKLNTSIVNNLLAFNGYNFIRRDRVNSNSGRGILIYLKNKIKIIKKQLNFDYEIVYLQMNNNSQSMVVHFIGCYKPPNVNISEFNDYLSNHTE